MPTDVSGQSSVSEVNESSERSFRRTIFLGRHNQWIDGYGSAVVLGGGGTWEEEVVEARVGGGKPVGQENP